MSRRDEEDREVRMKRWRAGDSSPVRFASATATPLLATPLLRARWEAIWRGAAFGRILMLRRVAAVVLVGRAAVLAMSRGPDEQSVVAVVVAARDLAPGTVVEADQVALRGLAAQAVPDGAARSPVAVVGRTLAAPVRRG